MSDAEQFKSAVPERSGPTDWRGGLERSGARRGRVGRFSGGGPMRLTAIPRPRFTRARKIKRIAMVAIERGTIGIKAASERS